MEKALVFINYPELIPLNEKATEYDGYITIQDKFTYRIKLKIPNFPAVDNINCKIPSITEPHYINEINQKQCSSNIIDYLDNITKILNQYSTKQKKLDTGEFFNTVFKEYQQLSQHDSIEKLKTDKLFKTFKMKIKDSGHRFHYLSIREDSKHFKIAYYDLPKINSNHELLNEYESLITLFNTYYKIMEDLQPYFNVMDSVDTVCWVIDPPKPKRSDYTRRIMIGHNVSIQITFDPWNIYNLPQIQFMGSENGVAPFRISFINNLDNWDPEYDIIQNILRLIDLPYFPLAPTSEVQSNDLDFKVNECCICFCVHLNNKLPDEICKNSTCEQYFHTECLYQWLSAVGTSRQNFNLIQGECPNCKTCITCPIPNI